MRRKRRNDVETLRLLKLIKGKRLQDVTLHHGKEWQLHFEDWVVFVERPFPSPIIERINWDR